MRSHLVTGASTGIGLASVEALLQRGFRVFGSVRKEADGTRLAGRLGPNFVPLVFDVTDEAAIARAAASVREALKGETLAGLVNNAGIAVPGPLLHQSPDDVRRQLEVNVVGQLMVTQAFAPLLGADRALKGEPGRIVMMSSQSGKGGFPFMGAYAASKHALEGLSESLRRELMVYGIDVILIGPGQVKTPIWDKAEAEDTARYANTDYAASLELLKKSAVESGRTSGLPVEKLGRLVADVLTMASPKVRYPVSSDRMQSLVVSVLPKRMVDRIVAKRLGLTRIR
jgi:NAD(P)-dependent dehydrogenase (short-subunit alcohol dehydrogenase family)